MFRRVAVILIGLLMSVGSAFTFYILVKHHMMDESTRMCIAFNMVIGVFMVLFSKSFLREWDWLNKD